MKTNNTIKFILNFISIFLTAFTVSVAYDILIGHKGLSEIDFAYTIFISIVFGLMSFWGTAIKNSKK